MKRSADPLTAATTAILRPAITPHGFEALSRRRFARVRAGILHFFDLQLSAWGNKRFCVNYAAISLYSPRDHLVLQPGGRLRKDAGGEMWLPAADHDSADQSVLEIVKCFKAQAMPFFDGAQTTGGYLNTLENEKWGSMHHLFFERACAYAHHGLVGSARDATKRAIDLDRKDGRPWCTKGIALSEELLAAVENGGSEVLLTRWTDHSIDKLRLEKFLKKYYPKM